MATSYEGEAIKSDGLWRNGPAPGTIYRFPGSISTDDKFINRTLSPSVTGTSVLGIAFDGGVAIAADMLGSYGSLARYRQVDRVIKVNDSIVLGASGDYADFQFLRDIIEDKVIEDQCADDGFSMKPKSLYSWLNRVMYNRRSKFDPLWNTYVIGGRQDGESFLGFVDKLGTAFQSRHIATGYGMYIALPILREAVDKNPKMNKAEARELLKTCLRVLFYRDARSYNKFQIGFVTDEGTTIEGPLELDTDWKFGLKNDEDPM